MVRSRSRSESDSPTHTIGVMPFSSSAWTFVFTSSSVSPLLAAWRLGWRPRWLHGVVAVLAEPKVWLVLLPAYWVARNLPWFPFTLLAPG